MDQSKNKILKHWVVLMTLCGITVSGIGIPIMSSGVFIKPVSESLNVLRGNFSLHNTISMIIGSLMAMYAPILIQKINFKKIFLIGSFLIVISTIGFGFSTSLIMFNLFGVIRGIGMGFSSVVLLVTIVNNWFEEKQGLATSIVMSFSGVAGAIFSPIFSFLLDSIGWQYSYFAMAAFILLFTLPALLIPYEIDPQEEGLLPYGYAVEVVPTHESTSISKSVLDKNEIRWSVLLLFSVFAIFQTAVTGIPQHFPGFAESIQLSPQLGAGMVSASMIGSILFKLGVGSISDFVGPVKATLSVLFLVLTAALLILFVDTSVTYLIGSFLFGASYSVPAVGVTLLTEEFFGRDNFLSIYPKISFIVGLGGASSISIVGFIYDFTGGYLNAFILGIVITTVSFLIISVLSKMTTSEQVGQLKRTT